MTDPKDPNAEPGEGAVTDPDKGEDEVVETADGDEGDEDGEDDDL